MKTYTGKLVSRARALRKEMPPAERRLWHEGLRHLPWRFRRQRPIGLYIVDFYCASTRLVIELDGSSHDDEAAQQYDQARTEYLQIQGFKVMRFTNAEVMQNLEGVLAPIRLAIEADPSVGGADISPASRGDTH